MMDSMRVRFPVMALAILALLLGLLAGLIRLGWNLPLVLLTLPGGHGPLMVSGFLGTLIGLERAVARNKKWAFAPPVLTAAGALILLFGPIVVGQILITLGSLTLAGVFGTILRERVALFTLSLWIGTLT